MRSEKIKIKKGFTLVEIIVAVALFSLVVVISLGAVMTIFDANRRAQSTKTAVDNLNLSLENMVRTVRFGDTYHCDGSNPDNIDEPQSCASGDIFLAVQFDGQTVAYKLCGTAIKSAVNEEDCNDMKAVTSPETVIQYLKFYVFNTDDDSKQPYVMAVIKGYVGNKPTIQSSFSIQTVMSQRALDLQ